MAIKAVAVRSLNDWLKLNNIFFHLFLPTYNVSWTFLN